MKITALGSDRFSASEIDILSPIGDSVQLDQFGILAEDAVFEHSGSDNGSEEGTAAYSGEKRTGSNEPESPRVPS